jgi:hypothetical protein
MSTLQLGQAQGLGYSIDQFTEDALRTFVTDLYFESNVTPRIRVEDPFGPVVPSFVGRMVQPKVTLVSPQLGAKAISPWGEPNPSTFPTLVVAASLGMATLVYFAWKGIRA